MAEEIRKMRFGLKELPPDNRDFKLSAILKLPPLEELPENFELEPVSVYDQLESDYCSAESTCGASSIQEGVELSPEWSFAVSKMISGDPEEYGQDLRTAMKVHTKYGAIEISEAPYSVKSDEDTKIRYINNWPQELFEKAQKHKKLSFIQIDGPYSHFDNIRAFIWAFRAQKRACIMGVEWSWPMNMKVIELSFAPGSGHAIYAIGWRNINGKNYLVIQNSYGKETGDNGRHYFPAEIINKFAEKYGKFAFIDMPQNEIKKKIWPLWMRIFEAIKKYFNELLK